MSPGAGDAAEREAERLIAKLWRGHISVLMRSEIAAEMRALVAAVATLAAERDGLKAEVERLAAPLLAAGAPETEWESRYMKPTVTTHCPRCGWSAAPAAGEAKP